MDWKNKGIEGFEISENGQLVLALIDREHMVQLAEYCLSGELVATDDDGELMLECHDPKQLVPLARDLLIAATATHFDIPLTRH